MSPRYCPVRLAGRVELRVCQLEHAIRTCIPLSVPSTVNYRYAEGIDLLVSVKVQILRVRSGNIERASLLSIPNYVLSDSHAIHRFFQSAASMLMRCIDARAMDGCLVPTEGVLLSPLEQYREVDTDIHVFPDWLNVSEALPDSTLVRFLFLS